MSVGSRTIVRESGAGRRTSGADSDDVDRLWRQIAEQVQPALRDRKLTGPAARLGKRKVVLDDTVKILVATSEGRPGAVLICSSPPSPDLVARGVDASQRAKRLLGRELGRVILEPLATGHVDGLSFVLLPWWRPVAESRYAWVVQRSLLRSHLLRWLRAATRTTVHAPADAHATGFAEALRFIAQFRRLGDRIRHAASTGAERLDKSRWSPRYVLAHNDLWEGNVLLEPHAPWLGAARGTFAIIDWPGAKLSGYPLYDLVRIAESLKVSKTSLREEVERHFAILGCGVADARSYLAAALGDLALHREHLSEDRFIAIAEACWSTLDTIDPGL